LTAAQFGGHGVEIDRETGRHAFDDGDQRLAVGLAGGQKTQHPALILSEKFAASGARRFDRPGVLPGPFSCTVVTVHVREATPQRL
jgi:hypothetical protein